MNITVNTQFLELDEVLREFVGSVQDILSDNFVGAYLQGSFAVGDADEHSDCDFIIVMDRELSEDHLRELRPLHKRIYDIDKEWAKHLEGSYFPKAMLRDFAHSGRDLWYVDHGSTVMERSSHCNTVIVRWILRERGVVLVGPEPSTLIDPISADVLRRAILASINDSGHEILTHPDRYRNRFYQGYIVLQYCRKLHNLHVGEAGSKRQGAEWAKRNLDQCWVDLIDRAWACRPDPAVSVRQPPDAADFARTLDFVREVMRLANAFPLDAPD